MEFTNKYMQDIEDRSAGAVRDLKKFARQFVRWSGRLPDVLLPSHVAYLLAAPTRTKSTS